MRGRFQPCYDPGVNWSRRRDRGLAWGIFLLATLVYVQSPVRQYGDSFYSLLLSESLLTRQSFALDPYFSVPLAPEIYPGMRPGRATELPYQIKRSRGHLYYSFPPGSSILSVPFVALGQFFGYSPVAPDGRYDKEGEQRLQRRLAALLCALTVVVLFAASRHLLGRVSSLIIAFGAGFATPLWSTASRALWSHTWLVFLIALVVAELIRAETVEAGRDVRAIWLGSLLGISLWVRPTAVIPIAAMAVWMILRHRDRIVGFFAPLAASGLLFVAYAESLYARLLPPYYAPGRASGKFLLEALAANLVSPGRGVLVYTPVLLFLAWILLRYRARPFAPDLSAMAISIVAAHWLLSSTLPQWWAGQCYGPRLMTDLVPWFALLGVLAVARRQRAARMVALSRRLEALVGLLLLVVSVGMHAAGALSYASTRWNVEPVNVDEKPARVWDWSHPQFMAWLQLPPVERQGQGAKGAVHRR
jgi:hypothetical protein